MSLKDTNILEEDTAELSLPTAIRVRNISEINFELADSPGTSDLVSNKRKISNSPQPPETVNINNNCKRSKSERSPTSVNEEIDNNSQVDTTTSENHETPESINSGQSPNCSLNDSNNNDDENATNKIKSEKKDDDEKDSNTNSDHESNAATASVDDNKDSKLKIKTEVKVDDEDESNSVSDPNVATTSVKTEATSTTRDSCRYGVRCYRRNPMHRSEEAHPGDSDYRRPDFPSPPIGTPPCPFGDKCYRRHPSHFQQYSHPPATDFNKNWKIRQMVLRKRKQTNYAQNDSDDDDDYDLSDPFIDDNSGDEYKVEEDEDSDSDC